MAYDLRTGFCFITKKNKYTEDLDAILLLTNPLSFYSCFEKNNNNNKWKLSWLFQSWIPWVKWTNFEIKDYLSRLLEVTKICLTILNIYALSAKCYCLQSFNIHLPLTPVILTLQKQPDPRFLSAKSWWFSFEHLPHLILTKG